MIFPHRAVGEACVGAIADPARSPLFEDPTPGSVPETLTGRNSLKAVSLSRHAIRARERTFRHLGEHVFAVAYFPLRLARQIRHAGSGQEDAWAAAWEIAQMHLLHST